MSYKQIPFTWGAKPLLWINAKTDANLWDTVWNTDWDIMEIWDGDMWVNDQAVKRLSRGNSVDSITVGKGVALDGNGHCLLSTTSSKQEYAGINIRGNAVGGTQSNLLIAFMGTWPVSMNAGVTLGNQFELSTNGDFVGTAVPGGDACGIITSGTSSAGLVSCVLQTVELV